MYTQNHDHNNPFPMVSDPTGSLSCVWLGRVPYDEALSLQYTLVQRRMDRQIGDTLLLLEHPPVITLGIRGKTQNILLPDAWLAQQGIAVHRVTRGGDVTYHGPGQLVGYPIMDIRPWGVRHFVETLQQAFVSLLREHFSLSASIGIQTHTGVWVGHDKITAVGIALKRGISMHGFAFNVNTCLEHFRWINPCGITDRGVTSLQKLMGHPIDMAWMVSETASAIARNLSLSFTLTHHTDYRHLLES